MLMGWKNRRIRTGYGVDERKSRWARRARTKRILFYVQCDPDRIAGTCSSAVRGGIDGVYGGGEAGYVFPS